MARRDRAPCGLRGGDRKRALDRHDDGDDQARGGGCGADPARRARRGAAERQVPGCRGRHCVCGRASGCCSPGPRDRENRRCSAPSPASGRSARATVVAAAQSQDHDLAATALSADRHARRRGELSGSRRHARRRRASPSCSTRSACRRSPGGWTKTRIGTGCSRSASSSASESRAQSCMRPIICCSMRPPPRSTSRPRPRYTSCCTSGCPNATIISIGHRSTLAAFHNRRLTLARDGEGYRVQEAALNPAT